MMSIGRAGVYFCDPAIAWFDDVSKSTKHGCGLFSFYKPEEHRVVGCPGCGKVRTMVDTGDVALIAIESKS